MAGILSDASHPSSPDPMRHKLDPDAILSALLLYLILAGYVASVYTLVMSVGLSMGLVPGQDMRIIFSPPLWVNIVVISIVALTILPVRRWLLASINNLVYGEHDDPYALVSRVNVQLQDMVSPQMTLPIVARTIAEALKLPYLSIQVGTHSAPLQIEFGVRPEPSDLSAFRLLYLDRSLGELCVGTRRRNEGLSGADTNLLRDLARQIGIALHAHQVSVDLKESRERLVIAREEERRRIRNDLHDGLAPTLSSLQLQLGSLRTLVRQDPDRAQAIVDDMRADLRGATAAIRELVYNLRPPMLDELGLLGALKSLRFPDSTLHLEFSAPDPMPALSAAVEVAVYRIASEAIHNVIKHSGAARCIVALECGDRRLTLSVSDDGTSIPHGNSPGVGLHSMQERVAELGGTLVIQTCEGGGTCLVAQFPVSN